MADNPPALRDEPDPTPGREDELSILDLLIVIAKHKWLVLGLPLLAAVLAAVISTQLSHRYTATARLLPPQQSQSATAALMGQLGQMGALAGGAAGVLGLRTPSDLYVGMLQSRSIADALIDRFELMQVYNAELRSDARRALANASRIVAGKDNLISIEVEDVDPQRAAALANGYVEELIRLTGVLAVTEASQRRLFFERQLIQAKDNLLQAELAARGALERGGLAMVDAQGRALVQTSAALRARIAAKEVEINAMRSFASENNPELRRAREELAALREQIARMERGDGQARRSNAGTNEDPGVHNLALLREVKYHEVLFELLARQYELSKIDEAKESTVVQLLDAAVEPDRRSWPRRTLIVAVAALATFVVAVLLAFIREALERTSRTPDGRRRLAELRRNLGGRG